MAGDTKEVGDIRDKDKEMDVDTTMDVVDVDLVGETTKLPLVSKVNPTTKSKIMMAKITTAVIKIMATTSNIITVVLLVTMVIISTRVPIKIQIRGRTKVSLTQEEMINTISI